VVKRDGNHGAIVEALKARGCTVVDLSSVGSGCPDLLVAWSGKCVLLEIKDPEGRDRIEPIQAQWHASWKGPSVVVVRSVREALEATGVKLAAA
jgi:Holliday junction resolvase